MLLLLLLLFFSLLILLPVCVWFFYIFWECIYSYCTVVFFCSCAFFFVSVVFSFVKSVVHHVISKRFLNFLSTHNLHSKLKILLFQHYLKLFCELFISRLPLLASWAAVEFLADLERGVQTSPICWSQHFSILSPLLWWLDSNTSYSASLRWEHRRSMSLYQRHLPLSLFLLLKKGI